MKNYFKLVTSGVFVLSSLFLMCSSVQDKSIPNNDLLTSERSYYTSDSVELVFQNIIDSSYDFIFNNNILFTQVEKLQDSVDFFKNQLILRKQEIVNNQNDKLSQIFNLGASKKTEVWQIVNEAVKIHNKLEIDTLGLAHSIVLNEDSLLKIRKRISENQIQFDTIIRKIKNKSDSFIGLHHFTFNGISCRVFIAKKGVHEIQIHANSNGPFTFTDYEKFLVDKKNDTPFMMTNGGMFMPDYRPQGILIDNYKKIKDLDTATKNSSGNFYLYPNGVYFIDSSDNAFVLPTDSFKTETKFRKKLVKYATQSGPMLVIDGKINKKFTARSTNLNIRSGVGAISQDKVVFIISDKEINFYDFAVIFKNYFNCKNALYLDGAISKMYSNKENKQKPSGNFGPMISVHKKKK